MTDITNSKGSTWAPQLPSPEFQGGRRLGGLEGSRKFSEVLESPRRFSRVLEDSRRFSEVLEGSRSSSEALKAIGGSRSILGNQTLTLDIRVSIVGVSKLRKNTQHL